MDPVALFLMVGLPLFVLVLWGIVILMRRRPPGGPDNRPPPDKPGPPAPKLPLGPKGGVPNTIPDWVLESVGQVFIPKVKQHVSAGRSARRAERKAS